jgi:NADP-dependent 3-hydroxy acid dehydrogenase YdfG
MTMAQRTWLITGVSSGFGHELTRQLLEQGERVVGTVRRLDTVADLVERYPDTFSESCSTSPTPPPPHATWWTAASPGSDGSR